MSLPLVGTLYQPNADSPLGSNVPPVWTQPGGRGTQVLPQPYDSAAGQFEPPTVSVGMYIFLCNHVFNCPKIYKAFDDVTRKYFAVVCCPMCTVVQELIPYDEYLNNIQTPVIVA